MRDGHLVIDVDAHYLDPVEKLTAYMDEPIRSQIRGAQPRNFIPNLLGDATVGGRIRRPEFVSGYRDLNASIDLDSVKARLGVDAFVLVSNNVLDLGESNQREIVSAYYNAYMSYMLDHVVDPEKGIYLVIPTCWQDPDAGANLIHESADHPAVVGVNLVASLHPLGDARYNVIYQAAQDHNLPIVFHATRGSLSQLGVPLAGEFQKLVEAQTVGFALSNIIQLTSLLVSGLPERFPSLKFVFEESGLFWIPMVMYRLDQAFLKRRSEAPLLKRLPSEYLREHCYFATQPIESPKDEIHLQAIMEMIGIDRLLYASDYPHWDYDDPVAISGLPFLSRTQKSMILAKNAQTVFDFGRGGEPVWAHTESVSSLKSPTVAG